MRALIPAKVAYQVVLPRPFGTGGIISPSPFWDVMPERADLPERISRAFQDMNLPAWVVENLAGDLVHVSGEDLDSFRDLVVITRMSRFGKLLELSRYLIPFIHSDEAGGLQLRHVGETDIYYAVRGRLMIMASSRDSLIQRLVLHETERLPKEVFDEFTKDSSTVSFKGSVFPPEGSSLAQYARWVGLIGVIQNGGDTVWKFKLVLSDRVQQKWAGVLDNTSPAPLSTLPDAMLEVAGNFGKPLDVLVAALQRATYERAGTSDTASLLPSPWDQFVPVLSAAGPGFCLGWYSIDLNEMFPMPELAGYVDGDMQKIETFFSSIPALPAEVNPWESYLRYDVETRRASLPMIGGPALEPTMAVQRDCLFVSTSAGLADRLLEKPPESRPLNKPGNLFVRFRPKRCWETLVEVGRLLAEQHLLKGYDSDSFNALAAEWDKKCAPVREVSVLLWVEDAALVGEVTMAFENTSEKEAIPQTPYVEGSAKTTN